MNWSYKRPGVRLDMPAITIDIDNGQVAQITVERWAANRISPREFWRLVASIPLEVAAETRIGYHGGYDECF